VLLVLRHKPFPWRRITLERGERNRWRLGGYASLVDRDGLDRFREEHGSRAPKYFEPEMEFLALTQIYF
jgi:hypothetical protein